ncbi:MAG: hypothetical protein AAGH87_11470 [Pseudomonadota bacterium]
MTNAVVRLEPDLSRLVFFIALLLGAGAWHSESDGQVRSLFVAASLTLFGLAYGVRVARSWAAARQALCASDHIDEERLQTAFNEPFIWLVCALLAISTFLFTADWTAWPLNGPDRPDGSAPVSLTAPAILTALSVGVFLPLAALFYAFTKTELRVLDAQAWSEGAGRLREPRAFFRRDVFSKWTIIVSGVSFALIIALAWLAGADAFDLSNHVGTYVMTAVVLCFAVVIFSPHIVRRLNQYHDHRPEAGSMAVKAAGWAVSPVASFSYLDSALVRLFAPLSGATLTGQAWKPYAALLGVIIPLCAIGYALPAPFGFAPLVLAALIVIGLGRRWAWVEDDRELAARIRTTRGPNFHIGFRNDLKDEALLGYACFFVLIPLLLNEVQEWRAPFALDEQHSVGNGFLDWISFFGAELAKAVPFVDWWEIYDVDVEVAYGPSENDPFAKHLTFAARAIVDLVIVAALVQAFSLWQRSETQKRLYQDGQIDSFDPFTELDVFDAGMVRTNLPASAEPPKVPDQAGLENYVIAGDEGDNWRARPKFIRQILQHIDRRHALGFDPVPYNRRRLGDMRRDRAGEPDVRYGAIWLIKAFRVLAGSGQEQLQDLAQATSVETVPRMDDDQLRELRTQMERIIAELARSTVKRGPDLVTDLYALLGAAKDQTDFESVRDTAILLLEGEVSVSAVFALAGLAAPNWAYVPGEVRTQIERTLKRDRVADAPAFCAAAHFKQAPLRARVYRALDGLARRAQEPGRDNRVYDRVIDVLIAASAETGDRAEASARRVAKERLQKLSQRARLPLDA